MKPSNQLLFAVIFIFSSVSCKSKKAPHKKYTDYDHGIYLSYLKKMDSAFLMFNRYVNAPDDTLKKGKAYSNMGEIQWKTGDLYGAQESLNNAIHTLDTLNAEHSGEIGEIYNLLGNVSLNLKLYDSAIGYYNLAMSFTGVSDQILESMNGKATALQKKGNYSDAIAIYDSILRFKPHNLQIVARAIDNRATTKLLQDPAYPALPELRSALKIRADSQDNSGLNASYAHLSDYYTKLNPDSALWYAQKMREAARENQSPEDVLEAIDKLITLSNPSALKHLYEEYKILNDSLHYSRDTTRSRFALIRYDFQKSKTDNLVLKQHITRQQLSIFGLIAGAVVIITWLSVRYSKRRKRMKEESENAIRDSKLKTSQKVHDVVANGLYRIMNELEHGTTIDKEPLINKIDDLYEKSRDISYEGNASGDDEAYAGQIHLLLTAFDNKQTHVKITGNEQGFWNMISRLQKRELELVLNELMINMKKHSRAKNVLINFKNELNNALITYSDDGIGFSPEQQLGNGLSNTVNRIRALNGNVTFGKSREEGVLISLSFPLQLKRT